MLPQRRQPDMASSGLSNQDYRRFGGAGSRRRPDVADDEAEDECTEDEEEIWRQNAMLLVDDDQDEELTLPRNLRRNHQDDQDDSSLSIAQSGCHSILSAWRTRVSRASQRNQPRPTSVLSNATSACSKKTNSSQNRKRGKSPASQTRIPLGPRHVQHFVTNTRRRRQADELVLNAMEARRRALQTQRQQASLFDDQSLDYHLHQQLNSRPNSRTGGHPLEAPTGSLIKRRSNSPGLYANSRFSLSPSPLQEPLSSRLRSSNRCPSPRASPESQQARRAVKPSSQISAGAVGGNNNSGSPASAAQRQRLLRAAADPQVRRTPPLAKLDQNSSDLCSQNSSRASSLDDDRSSYSSSGSQFTQLVTAELAPDCAFLDLQAQVRALEANDSWRQQVKPSQRNKKQPDATAPPTKSSSNRQVTSSIQSQQPAPKKAQQQPVIMKDVESEDLDETDGGKLRRGALKRDSIRRLRLNRSHHSANNYSTSSVSSELTPPSALESHPHLQQPLSRASLSTPLEHAARNNLLRNQSPPKATGTKLASPPGRGASQRARSVPETEVSGRLNADQNEPPYTGSNKVGKLESKPIPARPAATQVRHHRLTVEPRQPAQASASLLDLPDASSSAAKYLTSTARQLVSQMSTNEQRLAAMRAAGAQKGREAALNHLMALREGSKSRDDLRFDATGNKMHQQVSESWCEERSPNQFKSISQRTEITRSEMHNISPPPAFADTSTKSTTKKQAEIPSSSLNTNRYPTKPSEQPVAPTRRRVSSTTEKPSVILPKPKLQSPSKPEVSLPRLESSANDEFKKRIEKLRSTARANSVLSSSAGRQPSSTTQKPIATRPMSIAKWQPQPATTNLDALMLASDLIERPGQTASPDRHERQPPPNLRAWRRSNSSLARTSLPTSTNGSEQLQQPPKNPSPAPVKLVVKERSAPRPDFAFVAPQAPVNSQTSQMPAGQHQLNQPQLNSTGRSSFIMPTDQQPSGRLRRSFSPKSPDIGGQPSSSNEDSAIASSVSSPSLSYMMNNQQLPPSLNTTTQPPAQLRPPPPPPPPQQVQQQPSQPQQPAQVSIRKAPESGALQSILRRQQQQFGPEKSAVAPVDFDSGPIKRQVTTYQDERLQSPVIGSRPEVRSAEPQHQQPQQAIISSPAKRVHFNDLASVRSFESISSQTSNSTAVPNEVLRQQVGSPDSMASSSGHSRLSSDSPELRSSCRDGAAIYAIRGDPELELDTPTLPPPLILPSLLYPSMTQTTMAPIQQQHLSVSKPSNLGYTLQRVPALGHQTNPLGDLHQQHQPVFGGVIHPSAGFINMTAPPASNVRHPQQLPHPSALVPQRLILSPMQMSASPSVPQSYLHQMAQPPTTGDMQAMRHVSLPETNPDDDDDPNYALRLRQASTRGTAFTGLPLQQQQQHQHQQQASLKPPPPVPRRLSSDLCNFQTEV